ncbi:hypothetical protein [Inmirania thermothiophila]|uniref:Copper resistance protein D n=1 Tax=Inmirania thermothiophila TaxID=1750597 RepID=A0A3N1XS84_9GAMM|nr:hypothetical protein [Inmirania thermothiophila]ROR29496.1 hypothetical protein EDC57_2166 [Inmirania thermothiophila]
MDLVIARLVHVLAVVLWIGGVGLVALVLLPQLRAEPDAAAAFARFRDVVRRFAAIARWLVALAGIAGLHMLARLDAWGRFAVPRFWWMHAMVALWTVFFLVLFVAQPLAERRDPAPDDPARALRLAQRAHWVLLAASLVTVAAAVAGAHGGL